MVLLLLPLLLSIETLVPILTEVGRGRWEEEVEEKDEDEEEKGRLRAVGAGGGSPLLVIIGGGSDPLCLSSLLLLAEEMEPETPLLLLLPILFLINFGKNIILPITITLSSFLAFFTETENSETQITRIK